MDKNTLRALLEDLRLGRVNTENALRKICTGPFEDLLNGVNIDQHRELRTGLAEVVFAQGKTLERLCAALGHIGEKHGAALASRVSP